MLFKLLQDNGLLYTTDFFFVIIFFCAWICVWFPWHCLIPFIYTCCIYILFHFHQSVTVLLKAPFCHYLLYLLLSNMNILIGGVIIVNINIMVQIKQQYPLWLTSVYYSILIWHFKGEQSKEGFSLCYWNLNCFCFEKDSKPLIQLCSDEEYIATFTPQLWIELSVFLASGCSFFIAKMLSFIVQF